MPIARFQMPDGRIARFEVPEGTSPEQAHSMISGNLNTIIPPTPEKESRPFHEFGTQDPAYEYGDILPFKRNKETGERSFAVPEAIRSPIRGIGDIIDIGENQSLGMTPDALAAFGAGIPALKGTSAVADVVAKPLLHPVETAVKLGKATANTATATAKSVAQPVIRKVIDETLLNDALQTDIAKEGRRLGDKFGFEFTAAEQSGNPTLRGMEDALANSSRWGGKFAERNQKKVNAIIGRFQGELDKISPETMSRPDVGDRIATAYRSTLDNLVKTRRSQAKIDFGQTGGQESNILSNNLFRELQTIRSEGDAKLLTKSKAHAARLANSLLKRVSSKTEAGNVQSELISLDDMANGLSDFSSEASRPGSLMDNVQSAAERRVYTRLYNALQKDLEAEIANPKADPERVAMLVTARDNYRQFSNQISDVQKTTLGKIVGKSDYDSEGNLVVAPEKIADRLISMEPTELRSTIGFLDKNHPDIAQATRRYILESSLRKAQEGIGQRGAGTTKEFAKAEFVKNLPDDDTLNILFKDKKSADDIRDIAAGINRMIDYGASQKGSQTFQRGEFAALWRGAKGMLFKAVMDDTLAEDLLTPSKRKRMATEAKLIKTMPVKKTVAKRSGTGHP